MKKIGLIGSLSVAMLWAGTGCQTMPRRSVPDTLVPFTARHMEDFGEYLEEIQFFISRQVVLHRTIESGTKDVTGAVKTVQVEKDMQIQSITFPARTPGVLFGIDDLTLHIQFEPGQDGQVNSLPFRPRSVAGGEGQPDKTVFVFDQADIVYGGSEFKVHYEEEDVAVTAADDTIYAEKARAEQGQFITKKRYPILLINTVRKINRYQEDNRVVPGMWEDNAPE